MLFGHVSISMQSVSHWKAWSLYRTGIVGKSIRKNRPSVVYMFCPLRHGSTYHLRKIPHTQHPTLHSKFMTPDVAMLLTRSGSFRKFGDDALVLLRHKI